jgi:hypothetical protein
MFLLLLSATSLLYLISASQYRFTDVAAYGLDRCNGDGNGPTTDQLGATSPLRDSVKSDRRLLAHASIYINKRNELIISQKNGGLVALVQGKSLAYPTYLKNRDSVLDPRSSSDHNMADARTNDLVVVFVPHSTRLEIKSSQFYKAFNDRADLGPKELVEHFVGKYITDKPTTRRFTLIVARIRRTDDAIRRRITVVSGPEPTQASDDSAEVPLSFTAQPGNIPTQLPAHLVSPGVNVKGGTQQTQVYSNTHQSGSRFQQRSNQPSNMFQSLY